MRPHMVNPKIEIFPPAAAMAVAARIDFWVDLLPGVEPGNDSSNAAVVLLL